jgi:pimeloyl-ACP methyl ester carboxylesterase
MIAKVAIATVGVTLSMGASVCYAAECKTLVGLGFGDAKIYEAEDVLGPIALTGMGMPPVKVDAQFCRVRGVIKPTSDSDIHFEVWLPPADKWNGKYEGIGNGGNAGAPIYSSMQYALAGGYAVSGQDTGHVGTMADSDFAIGHPEKVVDFGWRSLHETAVAAKAIITSFYDRAAKYSYYSGCSTGGRQGLALAQRFPDDYDGIVAGAPAYYWPELNAFGAEFYKNLMRNPGAWVSPEKLAVVNKATQAACHAVNGLIDDPGHCRFDLSTLLCQNGNAADCLTEEEITSLKLRYDDLRDARGNLVYPGFTQGAETDLAIWWMGPTFERRGVGSYAWLVPAFFRDYVHADPKWDVKNFDLGEDLAKAKNGVIGRAAYAENPDLAAFEARGGKLLQYQGWHDMAIPAQGSLRYYNSVADKMGGIQNIQPFYRLFMGTGMGHCGGGAGPNAVGSVFGLPAPTRDADHDLVAALARWVEEGKAPEQITATKYEGDDPAKGVVSQRLWCAYPAVARFNGQGDRNNAASYSCVAQDK